MKKIMIGLALAAACGCATKPEQTSPVTVKHVVLVGADGFGARWMPWEKMPNISKLRKDGLYAVARNSYPTSSGINWATVMFGTVVEVHGYRRWNSTCPDVAAPEIVLTDKGIPSCVFHELKKQEPSAYTVSLYNWDGIGFVHATNEVDYVRYFSQDSKEALDDKVISEGLKQFEAHRPRLSFLYQHLPDCNGHKYGWGTSEYTNACIHVDANVGQLVEGLKKIGAWEDTVIVLVADHGGLGKKHGMDNVGCFDVPFLVAGPAIKGMRLREPVLLADTAPTIMDLLGCKVPEIWRGRPAVAPCR